MRTLSLKKLFTAVSIILITLTSSAKDHIIVDVEVPVFDKQTNEFITVRWEVYNGTDSALIKKQGASISTQGETKTNGTLLVSDIAYIIRLIPVKVTEYNKKPVGENGWIADCIEEDDIRYEPQWIDVFITEERAKEGLIYLPPVYFTRKTHLLPQPERVSRSSGR